MDIEKYRIDEADMIVTPCLVYYEDIIELNTKKTIAMAGSAARLWPHVKTHKMAALVRMQLGLGITRFKCATIAEAEMAAQCKAGDVLLAYPLIGPNIARFLALQKKYPGTRFWALGDDYGQLSALARASLAQGLEMRLLIDVNIGMDRTGTEIEDAQALYIKCAGTGGLRPLGLHCFSGNYKQPEPEQRRKTVEEPVQAIFGVRAALKAGGLEFTTLIFGSTPSLPCYLQYEDDGIYLSPGTAFVTDYGYWSLFKDLDFEPGAAVLTRVISRTKAGLFTLDLGYKSIAADPKGLRGLILGYESAEPLFQCEEHWTFAMKKGEEDKAPRLGQTLYVIPTHICPTTALYPEALTARDGHITGSWEVTARNRKLTI